MYSSMCCTYTQSRTSSNYPTISQLVEGGPGTSFSVTIVRDGEIRDVTVPWVERPGNGKMPAMPPRRQPQPWGGPGHMGG